MKTHKDFTWTVAMGCEYEIEYDGRMYTMCGLVGAILILVLKILE